MFEIYIIGDLMENLLLVASGGALGATLRYGVSLFTTTFWTNSFPVSTLFVNVIGSFVIGLLGIFLQAKYSLKLFVIVGFLGSFTTFSSFSYETMQLINSKEFLTAVLNIVLNFVLCLTFVFLGAKAAKILIL